PANVSRRPFYEDDLERGPKIDINSLFTVRTKRVKEARDDAKKEINEYKSKKDEEFKKFEAEHSQGNQAAETEASKDAEKQIKEITEAGKKNQAGVVKNLLSAVFDVKPTPPSSV
ncbi:hypothetical protein Golomagni_07007, partial [Golovinomyces magnicellulatus]